MRIAPLLVTVLTAVTMLSCQNNSPQDETRLTTEATLLWTGEIAADGCGFEVVIDGKNYLPENEDAIPAKYKERDSTQVQLSYIPLKEPIDRRCGMIPQPRVMDAIRVVSVEEI
ncbi:hypothetical protein ACFSRY_18360 [Pontibacter locisalis]|uniref:Uncharacterized protein n=1 Tax=Pontibacter locisalis TaxID=1719035 RepID=A0ABW5IRX6_9BACT